jgi:hypothetical protein
MPEFGPFLSVGRKKAIPKTIADNAMDKIKIMEAMTLNLVRVVCRIGLCSHSPSKFDDAKENRYLPIKAKNAPECVKQ